MLDLVLVSPVLNNVGPAELLAIPYAGAPNSTATLGILQLTRTDILPHQVNVLEQEVKEKNTKRKSMRYRLRKQ